MLLHQIAICYKGQATACICRLLQGSLTGIIPSHCSVCTSACMTHTLPCGKPALENVHPTWQRLLIRHYWASVRLAWHAGASWAHHSRLGHHPGLWHLCCVSVWSLQPAGTAQQHGQSCGEMPTGLSHHTAQHPYAQQALSLLGSLRSSLAGAVSQTCMVSLARSFATSSCMSIALPVPIYCCCFSASKVFKVVTSVAESLPGSRQARVQ